MYFYIGNYYKLIIFLSILFFIFFVLERISVFFNDQNFRFYKNFPIECGCQPLSGGRSPIEVNFYPIALIFVVFEFETIIFIPWLLFWDLIFYETVVPVAIFLIFLIIGLVFELAKGIFDDF